MLVRVVARVSVTWAVTAFLGSGPVAVRRCSSGRCCRPTGPIARVATTTPLVLRKRTVTVAALVLAPPSQAEIVYVTAPAAGRAGITGAVWTRVAVPPAPPTNRLPGSLDG